MSEQADIARFYVSVIGGQVKTLLAAEWDGSHFVIKGHKVSIATIRTALKRIETQMGLITDELADALDAKTMSVVRWRSEMREVIAATHIISGALALGSIPTAVANADIQDRIQSEWGYLEGFALEIANG